MIWISVRSVCGAALPAEETYVGRVRVIRGREYSDERPEHRLDLYLPADRPPAGPTWVCWFGGAFVGGDKAVMARVACRIAAAGMAAAAPNYRLGDALRGVAAWPGVIADARAAVARLRADGAFDAAVSDRLIGLGHSSGAYLAMMVGFTGRRGDPALPHLDAVVNIAGVTDRRGLTGPSTIALFGRDRAGEPALQAEASPVLHVGPLSPPVFTLHGSADRIVSPGHAYKLDAALSAVGVAHRLRVVEGADHDPLTSETMDEILAWSAE
jgi:acetyl esterase/lipase